MGKKEKLNESEIVLDETPQIKEEDIVWDDSPKPSAPSPNGGGSGAAEPPLTSTSASEGSELGSWTTEANPFQSNKGVKPIDGVQVDKIVNPKKAGGYQPLVQEGIQKIEGMTMGVKYPEYSKPSTKQTFDFKQASQEVISKEQQAEKQESLNRKEQRRIESLPSEIESLRNERADLLLDKSPEAKRKLAANEAVTQKMQSDLDNISKSKYESLQNLNQKAVKGVELEVNEYLDENPKLRDEIKVKGLTDTETYNLVQQSVAKKIAPLEADLQIFQKEGTVDAAKDKIKISNELHARQEKIEGLAGQLKNYQDDYLKKAGFSDLNTQLNSSMESLKKYEPALNKAKAEVSGYEKELNQIKAKLDTYQSKVQGNSFNGTQQEFNDYKALEKDYNETINDLNNVYKNEALNGYEAAVNNYNSLAAKRSSIVKGLNNNEYNTIKGQYDTKVAEYDLALNDYKKFDEPEIKDRINKYFSTIQKIGEYDQKVKTTRGELAYVEDLEKAKEKFNNTGFGGDALDIGGRAVNSILDAAKKLVASPFRIAGSMSDVYGSGSDVYHYSDFVADLIEGKGSEKLFLTKEKNDFYNGKTDKINWGVVPVLSSVADQMGILLILAATGKVATPMVQSALTTAGADLTAAAEIAESAKIATTIAPAFMISYGDNYKEALEKGFSGEGAMAYSGALSLLEGLTETILPDQDLLFGKEAKGVMLNRFIKDYAKGKRFAIKNMTNDFLFNALGESTEEGIAALGKTLATSIGHLVDNDIEVEIPTMNQNITTSITAGLSGGGAGLIGNIKENSQMYKMGVMQFANDFEAGKALLSKLNEKGKIDDKRYNKLVSDVQKFQSVRSQIPQGLSNFKTMAIAEKMIAIKDLSSEMDDDKLNPFNKINAKKIDAIQGEIEQIIDDKNFDARAEYELNLEAKDIIQAKADAEAEKIALIAEQDDKYLRESLTKDEYELVTDLQVKIETLENSLDAIEDKDSKSLIEEQIAELSTQKKALLNKSIDNIVSRVQEKRKELGVEFDILEDLPPSVVSTFDRIDGDLPTDINAVQEASDYLYGKYKELRAMKNSKTRPLTIPQIDAFMGQLDEDITKLESYKNDARAKAESTLKKNTSPTNEKYGTVNRNDGKGIVDLTKEEYENEAGISQSNKETTANAENLEEKEVENISQSNKEEIKAEEVIEPSPIVENKEEIAEEKPYNDKKGANKDKEIVLNKQNDDNIPQQVDKEAANVGAVGDVAKGNESYKQSREATEAVSKENPDASILITPKGNDLNLTAVYVGKEKRGQGIGSKVLESVKKQADKLGKKVVLDTTNELDEETNLERLGKFYEKNGFVKVGENKFEYNPKKVAKGNEEVGNEDIASLRNANTKAEVENAILKATKSDNIKDGLDAAENLIGKAMYKAVFYSDHKKFASELADAIDAIEKKSKNKPTTNEKNPTPPAVNEQVQPTNVDSKVIEDGAKVEVKQTVEQVEKEQIKETEMLLNGEAEKRRKVGNFIKDGIEYVRNAVNKGVRGKKGEVKFAEGVPSMPFTYKLIEADEVQPSHIGGIRNQMHFIPEAQPKNRNDDGSKAAEIGFANNPRFNELGENTNAYSGAPIVNERNEVVQGNNRTAGLKIGYGNGNKQYKSDLAKNAAKFGLTKEQVEGMKNPILVREVAFSDESAIEFGNYDVKDLETGGKRRLDPIALVKRIPIKTKAALTKLLFSGEGTLNSSIRENSKKVLELISPFINQAQRNTLLKDGELSANGAEDLEAVIQQFLFDNGDMALPELFDGLSHKQKEGIRKSLPSIFSVGIEANLIPEIQNAILAVNQFVSSGLEAVDNWLNQPDMFMDGKTPNDIYTPQELAIVRILIEAKTQSDIVTKFKEFASAVEGIPDIPANLLEEAVEGVKGKSKEQALKEIFNVKENENRKQNNQQKDSTGSGKKANSQEGEKPEVKTAKQLAEPKNATDVAKIFRNLFNFSPKESVWAARLFEAKAAFMSKVKGISKEDYYKQYWLGNKGDGGLSQQTLPDGRNVTVKNLGADVINGFYSPLEKVITDSKFDKLPAKQWIEKFARGEEAKWTGLTEWLNQQQGSVSKADIQNYLKDNRIQVVEVVKTEDGTGTDESVMNDTKFSQYQLEGEKSNYKEVLVTMPTERSKIAQRRSELAALDRERPLTESEQKEYDNLQQRWKKDEGVFKSSHFDEPNILVHLRMNTRTDAEGNKVLFIEEVQSDWGQQGKKEGFEIKEEDRWNFEPIKRNGETVAWKIELKSDKNIGGIGNTKEDAIKDANKRYGTEINTLEKQQKGVPSAPFVTDTNAWTKLGLKVALKEAVKQGADKIAWTTGEQQNERYDLSKQVDEIKYKPLENGQFEVSVIKDGSTLQKQVMKESELEGNFGKDVAKRIVNRDGDFGGTMVQPVYSLKDKNLSVGGKGMKGFYGSPTEGSLGIVGNVAKSLFKQEPGTTNFESVEKQEKKVSTVEDIKVYSKMGYIFEEFYKPISKERAYKIIENGDWLIAKKPIAQTQHSIDITPELKSQASEGQPLFQDRKGSWSKEAAKMKRIISMYEKADSTTQVHEILGHDYLDEIIQSSENNKEAEADLRTIAEEYIKDTKSKEKAEDVIKTLKEFDVESNKSIKGTQVHEWFSEAAERYFATERDVKTETPQQSKMARIFEAFRQHLADLYSSMNKSLIAPSEPMKKVFRKVFGTENFNEAEVIRKNNTEDINKLNTSALENNKKPGGLKSLADKLKEKGLGQSEWAQDIWDAASEMIADGNAKRYNVTDKLKEMFPQIESDIEAMRKELQGIGAGKNLRGGAESILKNPNISDDVKEKVEAISEYTPETLKQVGLSTDEVLDYYINEYGEANGLDKVKALLDSGEFDGYTEKVAIQQSLIGLYNKLAKFGATEQIREDALASAVDVASSYSKGGTKLGQMINAYKLLGALTAEGRIVWAQRQTEKYVKPSIKNLRDSVSNLKKDLKDAYKEIDYFFEQSLGKEEMEGKYNEVIAAYQSEIDALKAKKAREPKPSKTAYKGVKATRKFKESDLANFAKDVLEGGLFQDMEGLTPAQKLAYGIMEKKPTNISEFAKAFSKYLGKKIDPSEVEDLYKQTRDLLIESDLSFSEGLSSNAQIKADIDGLKEANKARIEELERKKAEAQAKKDAKSKKNEKKEHSEELADFVIADAKKAIKGTIAKQKTYLDEVLKALKEKVGDVVKKDVKEKVHTAKVSEVEAIKFALDAINNGGADANMWNEAVDQVKAKINQDTELSQKDKDDLNSYLNDYTNFLYDNLLSENKIFKVVKEKLIQSGFGSGNQVNWSKLIKGEKGDIAAVRQYLQDIVKGQLSEYNDVQVEKVLDAIVYKYDQAVSEKRKEIADKYIDAQLSGKRSTKKKAVSVKGDIGKLIVENRLGLFEDSDKTLLNRLAEAKGLSSMTAADWATAREMAENVENAADGNLKNKAVEEMTAFIASKQPLAWMHTASALRFAGLLGRPLTILKNLVGNTIEGGLLAGGRTMRGDLNFIKDSFKGVTKGGFKDILLGGGINQSSKTSVEVDNSGMPYFRALEYGDKNKYVKSGKYVSRVLDATDSVYQEMFSSAYDKVYLEKYFKIENPNASKAEIDQMINDVFSKEKYDAFYEEAIQDVIKSGIKPTPANVKRRAYEILRNSQVPQVVRDMADLESTEKTFKSEFDDNKGLATILGKWIAKKTQLSKDLVKPIVKAVIKKTTSKDNYNEKAAEDIAEKIGQLVPNYLMPFTRGVSNIIEKGLEKEMVYGLSKALITKWGISKMPTTTIEEKMLKARAEEKVKDLASTAIFTGLITYGIGVAIALAAGDDDDEDNLSLTGIERDKSSVGGSSSVKERSKQENVLTIKGHKIPLSLLGSAGIAMGIDVNIYEALTAKPDPSKVSDSDFDKGKAMLIDMSAKVALSFFQNSFLMASNERKSMAEEVLAGNYNKAQNILETNAINYIGSYMLWSGFANQMLQGGRYLKGDKSFQEAKTTSEKVQKQMGLAGITYDNKRPNYIGRPLEATEVNREGIQGFIAMFSKNEKPAIEKWVEDVGYKETLVSRKNKQLAIIDEESFVSPTSEQYDDFTDEVRVETGRAITELYKKKNEIEIPLTDNGDVEINKKTGKPYTKAEYTAELLNDLSNGVEGYNKTKLINKLDKNKFDSEEEYEKALEKYSDKIEKVFYDLEMSGIPYSKESDAYAKENAIELREKILGQP